MSNKKSTLLFPPPFNTLASPEAGGSALHEARMRPEARRSRRKPVLSARFDSGLLLADANREFCNLMRAPLNALLGKRFRDLCKVYRSFTQACEGAHYMMEFEYAEVVLVDSCNTNIYANMTSVWMRSADGHLESVSVFVTDFPSPASQRGERMITGADSLAGLLNGDSFRFELERVLEDPAPKRPAFLLLVSIDGVEHLGESFGRGNGLALLVEVAGRLHRLVRNAGKCGRYRINEFLLLCETDEQGAQRLSQAMLDAFGECFVLNDEEVYLSASIGMCRVDDIGNNADAVIAGAEAALRCAKKRGGSICVRYTEEIGREAKFKGELERSLRKALARGEMELEYQPRIDLRSMKVVALEALIRWNHPGYGRIAPLEFIPIAEERGLIFDIGKWVLEAACTKASELAHTVAGPMRVSVNVSAHQLKDSRFSDVIRSALAQSNLPSHLLELELTESVLVEDCDRCADVLRDLKRLGVKLSVDDFGTGYSSLAYLQLFPFDTIKLDKSFINGRNASIDNRKLVRALIDMSHALELSVVAEGVECSETLQFLASCHCDEVQGYLMSRPLSVHALGEFLARRLAI